MTVTLFKYRIWCNTESDYIETDFRTTPPTVCPNNNVHSVNTDNVTIIDSYTNTNPATTAGTPIIHLDAPYEADGRTVVVNSPFPEGLYMWLSARGDDLNPTPPATGRGEGEKIWLSFDSPGTDSVEFQYSEPIELHDGHLSWKPVDNWCFEDEWSLSVVLSATTTVENAVGSGNCTLVPVASGLNTIVPAFDSEGNPIGDYDVNLTTAVPVPADGAGYWDVDKFADTVSPSTTPGLADYYLLDFPQQFYFIKNMTCGNPLGVWDFDAYKTEWVSSKWILKLDVTKATVGSGEIGGWIMSFRENVQ